MRSRKIICVGAVGTENLICYFRTRKGLRFYAIEDSPEKNLRLAITSLNHSNAGKLIRIQLTQETIKEELQPIKPKEVPQPWREAFHDYFWRERSRL